MAQVLLLYSEEAAGVKYYSQHSWQGERIVPRTKKSAPKTGTTKMAERKEQVWAMLCHLGTLSGFFIPFGNIIAPLVIWAVLKDESTLVADQGKEAMNFQISIFIYSLAAGLLILLIIGIPLLAAVVIFDVIVTIIASVKAGEGKMYRYPYSLRLIK